MKKWTRTLVMLFALVFFACAMATTAAAMDWTPINADTPSSTYNNIDSDASFRLMSDVTLQNFLSIAGNKNAVVTIDLNGFVLDVGAYNIQTNSGTIAIYDLNTDKPTVYWQESTNADYPGRWSRSSSTTDLVTRGGVITNSSDTSNSFVIVSTDGTFHMNGGNLVGGYATAGSAVSVLSGGTFNMSNGTICGNYATSGVTAGGVINMTGGTIEKNVVTNGGVLVSGDDFNVSGSPVVKDNETKSGTSRNVLLSPNKKINVVDDLTETADLGITPFLAEEGTQVVLAGGEHTLNATDVAQFSHDAGNYEVGITGKFALPVVFPDINGQPTTLVDWTPLSEAGGILPSGNYYLTGDMALDAYINVATNATINLFLNDHVLTSENPYVVDVSTGETLNLYDVANGTTRYWYKDANGRWNNPSTNRTLDNMNNITVGGALTGASMNGVSVANGTFTMYGGNIVGNGANDSLGGGVYVLQTSGKTATFTMEKGAIMGNKGDSGGGVCLSSAAFNVSGDVKVTDNTNGGNGATDVYLNNDNSVVTVVDALGTSADIGIYGRTPTVNSVFVQGCILHNLTQADVDKFTTNNTMYVLAYDGVTKEGKLAYWAPEGAPNVNGNANGRWEVVDGNTDTMDGGNYYLDTTVSGISAIQVSDTNYLYLNSKSISGAITVADDATLHIYDKQNGSGTMTGAVTNHGTLTIHGGTYRQEISTTTNVGVDGNPKFTGGLALTAPAKIQVTGVLTTGDTAIPLSVDGHTAGDTVVEIADSYQTGVLTLSNFTLDSQDFTMVLSQDRKSITLVELPEDLPEGVEGGWLPMPASTGSPTVVLNGNYYLTEDTTNLDNYTTAANGSVKLFTNGKVTTGMLTMGNSSNVVLFDNTAKTIVVAGAATLNDFTVGSGETLTIYGFSSLTIPSGKTLTVNAGGTVVNSGTLSGTVANSGLVTNDATATYDTSDVTNHGNGLFVCTAMPDAYATTAAFNLVVFGSDYDEDDWFNITNGTVTEEDDERAIFTGATGWTVSKPVLNTAAQSLTYTASVTYTTAGKDKSENVYVKNAGFIYPTTVVYSLDITAPELTLLNKTLYETDPVTWHAANSGVRSTATDTYLDTVTLHRTGWETPRTCTLGSDVFEATVDETAMGVYTYTVSATDEAGNVTSETLTIHVDPIIDEALVNLLSDYTTANQVIAANLWYSALTDTQKEHLLTNATGSDLVDTLNDELSNIAQEMADNVSIAINSADSIEDVEAAKAAYDVLTEEAEALVSDGDKDLLDDLVANATQAKAVKTMVEAVVLSDTAYEVQLSATQVYQTYVDDYTPNLLPSSVGNTVTAIEHNITPITDLLDMVAAVQTPYVKSELEAIMAAGNALSSVQSDLLWSTAHGEDYFVLASAILDVEYIESEITRTLSSVPMDEMDIRDVKLQVDSFPSEVKALVNPTLMADLTTAYNGLTLDGAVTAFEKATMDTRYAITVANITALETSYSALSQAQKDALTPTVQAIYTQLQSVKFILEKFQAIDMENLDSTMLSQVTEAVAAYRGSMDAFLVDIATDGTSAMLLCAVDTCADVTTLVNALDGDSTAAEIEEAQMAYDRLNDMAKCLIDPAVKDALDAAYTGLASDHQNTATTPTTTVTVTGLNSKVQTNEGAGVTRVKISVQAQDGAPTVAVTPTKDSKENILSVDVKLFAEYFVNEMLVGSEYVQPKTNETVVIKMELPAGYDLSTLEVWHVADSGARTLVRGVSLTTEDDVNYAVFESTSFSHFVFFAEKLVSTSSGISSYTSNVAATQNGTVTISGTRNKMNSTVTITPKPNVGYEVASVTVTYTSGREVTVTDKGNGTYTYTQPGANVTVTVTFKAIGTTEGDFFADVATDDWFYNAVKWAVDENVTQGKSATTFAPGDINSRAEAVTFLYRAMGEPAHGQKNVFTDLVTNGFYYDAVLWAVENNITNGTGNGTTFSPSMTCTRGQIITFLWRMMGQPTANGTSQFADVAQGTYYHDAVLWAVEEGITEGTGNGVFSPDKDCTRAEIVTFLYRTLAD